ncbi:hypothetical protein BDM02DRAFT_3129556 [Thelephora ganbajun]|uniref:Uncharacterized protein n=1 Tax=Thelephora ganbajun TaxID=370292 RepID=A0ACB6ZDR7_THEGA|nr:hypothetical protein BDM02DRAFT_3129556 [Thelephora ganbajun]
MTDSAPVEIICDIFRHATLLPQLNCDDKSRVLFKEYLAVLLALTSSCSRWRAIALADPTLWTDIFVDVMTPDLLHLHLDRSAGLRLDVVITDPHPDTHFILCKEACRFRRLIVKDMKLSPIWGDAFPVVASDLEELRIDAHPNYPSLGFLVPIFDGSLPKLQSLQLRNVPFWTTGMFKGLRHLEFVNGVQTLPLFIPLVLDVIHASPLLETLSIETCCILPDPRYVCTVAPLPNLQRLRATSDAVSKFLHFIDVPVSTNIEIVRSFCEVAGPGLNVLSCLHTGLPWINFLDGTKDVTVLLDADTMSVRMTNRHGGVITIDVKDIPVGAHGLDDVMPPRYSPLLINTFGAMSCLATRKSISSLSIIIPEDARNVLLYTTIEGFTSPKWRHLLQGLENLTSLAVPLPFALLPTQVVVVSSSTFTMMCPSLKKVSITTDIPVDEVHDEQLRRITKFVEARCDSGFPLSSLDVDVSVATPISKQARAEYAKTWGASVGDVTFSVRF